MKTKAILLTAVLLLVGLVGTATGTHVVFNGSYQNGWGGVSTTNFNDETVVNASTNDTWLWKSMYASSGQDCSAESYWEWELYCASSGSGDQIGYYFVSPSGEEWNESYKFGGACTIDGNGYTLPQTLSTDTWHTIKFDMSAKAWWSSDSDSIQYLKYQFPEQGTYYMRNIKFTGGNGAPQVDAGNNTSITLPTNSLNLDATVSDDGLPDPPGSVTQTWTKQSGPGTVTFGNASAVDTSATFSTDGIYVLRLTASDSALQNYDEITITVNPEPGDGPPISNISTNASSYSNSEIPAYSRFEITFEVDTNAVNVQLPYDTSPPTGITPKIGVSVDAQFTPDNWTTTYSQPAFYYQDFDLQTKSGQDWMYPQDSYVWKVRFAPPTAGSWKFKLVAEDESGVSESDDYNFTVVSSDNPGFIRVSSTDERYFEYENGDPFYGLGYNFVFGSLSWDEPTAAESVFQTVTGYGMNYFRLWINNWGIYGGVSGAWNSPDPELHAQYYPEQALSMDVNTPEADSDICMKLRYDYCPVMWLGHMKKSPAVKQNTDYAVFVQYRIDSTMSGPRGSGSYGLVCKISDWNDYLYNSGQGTVVSDYAYQATDGWTTLTGSFNSGSNDFIPGGHFSLCLENVNTGAVAYINKVEIREDLGSGQYGPNIINHYWMSKHLYFDQRYSFAFDKVLELAEEYGVHFQLCIMEKNCWIMNRITDDGVNDEENWSNNYFYGYWTTITKNRWLQRAFWRYCQARWGYSTSVGAWELLNEGDPMHGRHWTQTDEFGKYMQQFPPNHHMTSTSTWSGFPRDEFWGNEAEYPDVDYADYHRYPPEVEDIAAEINSYNMSYGAKESGGAGKPLMLGETGYYNLGNLEDDTDAIWYHNYVWANINHGGMYQQYWCEQQEFDWTPDPRAHNKPYANFIEGTPLNNGHYVALSPTINGNDIHVYGQKDLTNENAHLWIQNDKHTWYNIVHDNQIGSVTGTIEIGGFTPSATYDLEWWDPYEPNEASQIISSTQVNANGSGVITLSVSNLVDDIAAKIFSTTEDTTAPTPNPLTWATQPYAAGPTSISMTATTASDSSGVEYYFDCTAGGGHDSGWQDSTSYTDTGLSELTQYTYRVQARDKSANQNTGGWSSSQAATTQDGTAPTPNPSTWATQPYATGSTSISMTATTASDPSGVQYYFDCTAGAGGHDSGWQSSATYQDTGLSASTQYSYRVQTRDQSANQNTGGWSTTQSATTDAAPDTTAPTPNPLTWATVPYATGTTSISMTATTASDPSGVEYFFDCTAGGGNDSGWQDSTTYEDTGLDPNTQYTYRVQARDKSANQNTGGWSTTQSATTDAESGGGTSYAVFDGGLQDNWAAGSGASVTTFGGYTVLDISGDAWSWHNVTRASDGADVTGTTYFEYEIYFDSGSSGDQVEWHITAPDGEEWTGTYQWLSPLAIDGESASTPYTVSQDTWHTIQLDCSAKNWWSTACSDMRYIKWQLPEASTVYIRKVRFYSEGGEDTTAPTPDPMTFATAPYATGTTSIAMVATTASDASGVEYYFDCTAGGGHDSGWQDSTSYTDTGLSELTQYTYCVQARDKSANQNATAWSSGQSATTEDGTAPTPDPMTFATAPYATGTTSIAMVATTASDASGVEYYFDCTAGGGHDSGWQDSTSYTDTGLSELTQYTYRVQARDKSSNQNATAWSSGQSATTEDGTAPTPNPSTWATQPHATGSTSISMTATTASDPSGVQYYFDCTAGAGGHDSGWQSGATYEDTGLNPSTQYSYRVQTRDQSSNQNTGGWSTTQSATTDAPADTTPPTPNPLTWATVPYATGTTSIAMVATSASDPSGVEYFFDCTAGGGHDSGWQDSTSYTDTGLSELTQYTYRVQARDKSANQNTGGWSTTQSATTEDGTAPTPNPMTWATQPYATGTTSISMTATTASDSSGVEYFFDCTAGGGHDSGWQDSASYTDTGLSELTQYTYRVQARDKSANQNTGGWSSSQAATTQDGTAPTPNPSTWATQPYATGTTSISMTATTASDASGVEYFFDCTAGGGNDSGWQDGTTYEDTGLDPDTQYTYRVQARDKSANQNTGSWSTSQSATTDAEGGASHVVFDGAYQNGWSGIGTTTFQSQTVMDASGSAWSWHGLSNSSAQDVSATTAWEYEIYFASSGSGDQIHWHFVSPSGNEWNETYKFASPATVDGNSESLPLTLSTDTWHTVSFDVSSKGWWSSDSDSIQYLKWQWPEACTVYIRNVQFVSE